MNEKIHFDDFAEQVALEAGFDVDTAKDYIYTMFEIIIEENEKGEPVRIRNFGNFHPVFAKERNAVNPQTREPMVIPAHHHAQFSPSKSLSDLVNAKYAHLNPKLIKEGQGKNWILGAAAALLLLVGGGLWLSSGSEETVIKEAQVQEEKAAPSVQEQEAAVQEAMKEEPPVVLAPEEPAVVAPPMALPSTISYDIQPTDTLYDISARQYGTPDYWPLLFHVNLENIKDPDLIYPGKPLKLPMQVNLTIQMQRDQMLTGYSEAYGRYKVLGRHQKALWLIFTGTRHVDAAILRSVTDPEDLKQINTYLERF